MIICQFCKTENNEKSKRCVSCGGLLKGRKTELTKEDRRLLVKYALIVENMLESSTKDIDLHAGFTMFAFAVIEAVIIYVTFANFEHWYWMVLIWALSFAVAFIIMSLLFYKYHEDAAKKKFNSRVRSMILNYLEKMDFREEDFKQVVSKDLDSESYLYRYVKEL